MIELQVYSVLYSLLSHHRIVLLKEVKGNRYLPIWIGQNEAEAIATRLQGTRLPRPLTHDLLKNVIVELGGELQYIVVDDLRSGTFYAKLALEYDGDGHMTDSRPSDAIALAVRAEVPIYVEEAVLREASIEPSPDIRPGVDEDLEDLDVFRNFVDNLDLDDLEE